MYRDGLGTTRDYKEAFKLYSLSANQGNNYADSSLYDLLQLDTISGREFVKNIMKENSVLNLLLSKERKINGELTQINEHLKLYPGHDYQEAMHDFNLTASI